MELAIAVVGLLAAIYALIPRERQLDLTLRIGLLDRIVLFIGCLLILYLEFNEFCQAHGWVLQRTWPEGITPQNTSYLVLLGLIIFFFVRLKYFGRLSRGKIRKFRDLLEQLYWADSFGELLTLVQRNLKDLFLIYHSGSLLYRIGKRFDPRNEIYRRVTSFEQNQNAIAEPQHGPRKVRALCNKAQRNFKYSPPVRWIIRCLPKVDKSQEAAHEIVHTVFLSRKFISALTQSRPYLGVKIINALKGSQDRFQFADLYLDALLRDSTSILFAELANNQNLGSDNRYYLSDTNRLLFFLLSDPELAHELRVYKPIGDFALSHLDELARDSNADPFNRATADYNRVGKWSSPLFAAIRFFDIMVKEAFFKDVQSHMWVFYIPRIVEKMARNYRTMDPLSDPKHEWPICYSYLIYECFSMMRDWILCIADATPGQKNAVLQSTRFDHQNDNIPKSSIIALCDAGRVILESDNLTSEFKNYLMNIVFKSYFELKASAKTADYATVLREGLRRGGILTPRDIKYRIELTKAFNHSKTEYLIKHPAEQVSELEFSVAGSR